MRSIDNEADLLRRIGRSIIVVACLQRSSNRRGALFDAKRDRVSTRFNSYWLSRNSALAAHNRKAFLGHPGRTVGREKYEEINDVFRSLTRLIGRPAQIAWAACRLVDAHRHKPLLRGRFRRRGIDADFSKREFRRRP